MLAATWRGLRFGLLFLTTSLNARASVVGRPAKLAFYFSLRVRHRSSTCARVRGASKGPATVGSCEAGAHVPASGGSSRRRISTISRDPGDQGHMRRLSSITAESAIRYRRPCCRPLEGAARRKVRAMEAWTSKVAPQFDRPLRERDTAGLLDALRAASVVNWQFHRACAQRYCDVVTKHSREASGPLDTSPCRRL
jgi:hypothetical protein